MPIIRRVFALCLSIVMCLSLALGALGASALDSVSQEVQAAIELESRTDDGLVEVELSSGQGVSATDWAALKNNGVTFQLRYYNTYYQFRPSDVSRTLGYNELNLSRTTVPEDLMDEICYKTGLEEDEFMIVMPSMLGTLPGVATIGICLDQEFMNYNGYSNLNIYGIDFVRNVSYRDAEDDEDGDENGRVRESSYGISAIGLAASGKTAQKAWSPWISFSTSVSRVMIVTAKKISTYGSMSWNQSGGSIQNASEATGKTNTSVTASNPSGASSSPTTDQNPNTGALSAQTVLWCGIAALGAATVLTLARTLRPSKRRD